MQSRKQVSSSKTKKFFLKWNSTALMKVFIKRQPCWGLLILKEERKRAAAGGTQGTAEAKLRQQWVGKRTISTKQVGRPIYVYALGASLCSLLLMRQSSLQNCELGFAARAAGLLLRGGDKEVSAMKILCRERKRRASIFYAGKWAASEPPLHLLICCSPSESKCRLGIKNALQLRPI